MNRAPVTVSSLYAEYALYGATIGMIHAQAASLAVYYAVHLGGDHDPLPDQVAAELVAELDDHAADFEAQIPARQAACANEVRRNGQIIA